MRRLLAILLMMYSHAVVPESQFSEWWDEVHFGAPCSTKIDREEMPSCVINVRHKPNWNLK